MQNNSNKHIIITASILLVIITFAILPLFTKSGGNITSTKEPDVSSYTEMKLTIFNNELCLIIGSSVSKKYDVDISVLPGEDILILKNGISVKTISEADSIAEDYDG